MHFFNDIIIFVYTLKVILFFLFVLTSDITGRSCEIMYIKEYIFCIKHLFLNLPRTGVRSHTTRACHACFYCTHSPRQYIPIMRRYYCRSHHLWIWNVFYYNNLLKTYCIQWRDMKLYNFWHILYMMGIRHNLIVLEADFDIILSFSEQVDLVVQKSIIVLFLL